MADLTNAQRAAILIDGVHANSDISAANADDSIARFVDVGGKLYLAGIAAGSTIITANHNGRSGSLSVTVESEPLVITLGTPEPK